MRSRKDLIFGDLFFPSPELTGFTIAQPSGQYWKTTEGDSLSCMSKVKNLFDPVKDLSKLHPSFQNIRTSPGWEPARYMVNEIFREFQDKDGNFIEQFQTTGFDARIFELYLFAYFLRSGYKVFQPGRPDYIIERNGQVVAVEATTVNPTGGMGGSSPIEGKQICSLEDLMKKYEELAIKLRNPLIHKASKPYLDLEHCKGLPFVLAIEAFHERNSLMFADAPLAQYLYGLKAAPSWNELGKLRVEFDPIKYSELGSIHSNFFSEPNTEHISAVLFSNSGTVAKFFRMGYLAGYHRGNITASRIGTYYNSDPDSATPLPFFYRLEEAFVSEPWGQGLVVIHNPNAANPLPKYFFVDAVQQYLKNGAIVADVPAFHPFGSKTIILRIKDETLRPPENSEDSIVCLLKKEFDDLKPMRNPMTELIGEEKEWFTHRNRSVIGTVIWDRTDNDYLFVILARDEKGQFRFIESGVPKKKREEVRENMLKAIAKLGSSGQTVFPQCD